MRGGPWPPGVDSFYALGFYKAIQYFNSGRPDAAIVLLDKTIAESTNPDLFQAARRGEEGDMITGLLLGMLTIVSVAYQKGLVSLDGGEVDMYYVDDPLKFVARVGASTSKGDLKFYLTHSRRLLELMSWAATSKTFVYDLESNKQPVLP